MTENKKTVALFSQAKSLSLDSIAAFIFFAGMVVLPLFFLPIQDFSIDSQKILFAVAIVLLSFFFWLLARLKSGSISIPTHPIFVSAAVIAAIFVVSSLFSPSIRNSLYGFSYEIGTAVSVIALFVLMFLSALFFQSQKTVVRLYQSFLVVFGVIFLFQIARLLGVDALSIGGYFGNKIANPIGKWNDLGVFAGMIALLSLITLESVGMRRGVRIAVSVSLAASLILLGITNFYLLWIILGAFSLTIFVYHFSFARFGKHAETVQQKPFPTPSGVVLIVSFIFLIGGSTIGGFLNEKLNIFQIEVRPAWASTLSVLKETIQESPLLGSGPNRFTHQWFRFKPDAINNSLFWNTEFSYGVGLLPTFAVTTGVLGAVAWLVFLALFLYYGARELLSGLLTQKQYVLFSSITLAIYFWIISLFYVPTGVVFALAFLFTGIFVGILAGEGRVKVLSFSYFDNPRLGFISVLILSVLIMGVVASGYSLSKKFFAIKHFHAARVAFAQSDISTAETRIFKSLNNDKSDTYYRALAEIKTRQIADLLVQQNISPESARSEFQRLLGAGIDAGKSAVQIDDTNSNNWLTLARVYAAVTPLVSGAYESARVSLAEAFSRNPKNPLLLLEHAHLEVRNQNNSEARRYISESLALKPDYAQAIFMLAQLEFTEGNTGEAIKRVEEASLLVPTDAGLFFQLGLLKFNSRDYGGAASAFEHAISLRSDFANARYFLGLSYANLDRDDDAISQFEELERTNPDNQEIQQILRNLKRGQDPIPFGSLEDRIAPPFDE